MAKKNKPKQTGRRAVLAPTPSIVHQGKRQVFPWLVVGLGGFLGSAGFLVYFSGFLSEFLRGETVIAYSQPLGDASELSMTSTWPIDRRNRFLRFSFVGSQQYATKKDTWVRISEDGSTVFPESPSEREQKPATQFAELDGTLIPARSSIKFRLPPFYEFANPRPQGRSGRIRLDL